MEDERDKSNRLRPPPPVPYTSLGPHLGALFRRAFGEGLRQPAARPAADEWERALYKTFDLLHPVPEGGDWMILAPGMPLRSPYTHQPWPAPVPYAGFYRERADAPGEYRAEDRGLTVYANRRLLPWQRRARLWPDENVASREEQGRVRFRGRPVAFSQHLRRTHAGDRRRIAGTRRSGGGHGGMPLRLSSAEDGLLAVFEFLKP